MIKTILFSAFSNYDCKFFQIKNINFPLNNDFTEIPLRCMYTCFSSYFSVKKLIEMVNLEHCSRE